MKMLFFWGFELIFGAKGYIFGAHPSLVLAWLPSGLERSAFL